MPIRQDVFHLSHFVVSSNLNLLGCASLEILASTICHKASLSIQTFHDTTTNCRSAIWKIWKTRVYRSRSPATSCGIAVFNFVGIPRKTFISIFLRGQMPKSSNPTRLLMKPCTPTATRLGRILSHAAFWNWDAPWLTNKMRNCRGTCRSTRFQHSIG